jgi:hypothetical protein
LHPGVSFRNPEAGFRRSFHGGFAWSGVPRVERGGGGASGNTGTGYNDPSYPPCLGVTRGDHVSWPTMKTMIPMTMMISLSTHGKILFSLMKFVFPDSSKFKAGVTNSGAMLYRHVVQATGGSGIVTLYLILHRCLKTHQITVLCYIYETYSGQDNIVTDMFIVNPAND